MVVGSGGDIVRRGEGMGDVSDNLPCPPRNVREKAIIHGTLYEVRYY